MEQIPGITEMVLAVCSGRAADGHHDTCVKEPKLMNMGLFLSPSTALLIKKPIQLITFCHFSYMSMNKLANRCVKILHILEIAAAFVSPAVAMTEM